MKKSVLFISIIFIGCSSPKDESVSPVINQEQTLFQTPKNFPSPVYDLSSNPVNQAGFQLGKELFNEPIYRETIPLHAQNAIIKHMRSHIMDMM